MSGFEVAGLVLGSLPVLVSALNLYNDTVSTVRKWRGFQREIKNLIRNLQTEQANFQNTCETLLNGIAPTTQIEEMILDPGGSLWQNKMIQKEIQLRLWRDHGLFIDNLEEVNEAINEMRSKLKIGLNGSVSVPTVPASIHPCSGSWY